MSKSAEKIDFATAARRLTISQANQRDRRRFRRALVTVRGRMLDTLGREHTCRTADLSPGDARIVGPVLPDVGERVIIYLEGLGRVTGSVARRGDDGAAIIFDFSVHKREKLAEQLTLILNKDLGVEEPPRAVSQENNRVQLQFETGETYEGEVLDFSLAGITIRSRRPPPLLGVWVRVGTVYGRVARLVENGFAVDFERRSPSAPTTD